MLVDWTECGKVLSGRALDKGESVSVFLVDEQTERLWETDRLQKFTPAADRLGQWSWPIDFCLYINRTSDVIQAGSWKDGKWAVEGSSFSNRLWRTAQNIRAFTNCPGADNWIRAEPIHPTVSLKAGDVVEVMVRSEISGRRYRAERFRPLKDRLQPAQWAQDLAAWINKTFDMIRAGCPDASGQRIKETADKAGNYIWVPHNSRLTVSWEVSQNKQAVQVLSGRDALEGERICAYLVDDLSGERLQSEDLVFKPAADRRALRDWVEDFCKEINKRAKNMRAGYYDDKGVLNVAHSFERNFIWTWRKGLRAFTTAPHLNNWEHAAPLLANEPMTVDERVIVRVCNKANGAVWETLLFAPKADRLKPALWVRDLSTLINQQSLFVRAGQPNPDTQVIETIADVYRSHIWVPKHSALEVKWDRVVPQSRGAVTSDRDAVEGESISLFVMDEATGEILERPTYKAVKDSLGQYLWPRRFASEVNRSSRYVQVGDKDENGVFTTFASGYKNRIWTPDQRLRAFTTSLDLDNWVMARPFSFERDLKAGDRMVVHVRSELTGYLYQTLTFSPALKNNKAAAADWTRALCEKLNKECVYLKAGCKNEKTRRIEPVADHDRNAIWVPVGSGLAVEVLNIGDKTRYAAPIEVQAGVDPQTGKAHVKIPFGSVMANEGQGPSLDMGLCWTKDTGWDIYGFSFMFSGESTPGNETVMIVSPDGNNDCFKSAQLSHDTLMFQNFKLKKNKAVSGEPWEVVHKNGVTERLGKVKKLTKKWYGVQGYLPTILKNATGYQVDLKWKDLEDDDMTKPLLVMLEAIVCKAPENSEGIKEVRLFESRIEGKTLFCTLYPDNGVLKTVFEISLEGPRNESISAFDSNDFWPIMSRFSGTFPFGNILSIKRTSQAGVAFAKIDYGQFNGYSNGVFFPVSAITQVRSEVMVDEFLYSEEYEGFPAGSLDGAIPPVTGSPSTSGSLGFSFGLRAVVSAYKRREQNMQETVRAYVYEKQKTIVSTRCADQASTTTLHFSDKGMLIKEEELQDKCLKTVEYERSEDTKQGTQTLRTTVTRGQHVDVSTAVVDADGNLIKSVENGVTKEWTYYRGAPKITTVVETRRVQRVNSLAHGIGLLVDYLNPIGWCLNIFSPRGLTWGTAEVTTQWESRYDTKHEKDVFNLPVVLECPGDSHYFKTYIESEKVYVEKGGVRTDLTWVFYSYTLLPERNGCDNAIKPLAKLTVLYPSSTDNKKLDKLPSRSMSLEENAYVTDVNDRNFGRLLEQESHRIDNYGNRLISSRHHVRYAYVVKDGVLTTTVTEQSGAGDVYKSVTRIASDIASGLKVHATDWLESQTKWSYDAHGRLVTQIENANASKAAERLMTHYEHHSFLKGYSITTVSPENEQSRVEYDLDGNETKRWTRGAGFIGWRLLSCVDYNVAGLPVARTELDYLPDGTLFSKQQWRLHYDGWGELRETELPDGGRMYCEYDLKNPDAVKKTEYTKVGGKTNKKVVSTFDRRGNQTRLELQNGSGEPQAWTDCSFDAGDRLISSKDNHGVELAYTYDNRNRVRSTTKGGVVIHVDYPVHSSVADKLEVAEAGKTEGRVELGSRTISALSCVTKTSVGGRQVDYAYEGVSPLGKRTTLFPVLDEAFAKHSVEHSVKRNPRCGSVEEAHTVAGAKSSVTDVFSLRGCPLSFTNAFGQKTVYHYDCAGRRVKAVSNEVHTTFIYDGFGTLTGETVWHVAARSTASISYTSNALGQETGRSFVIDEKHKLHLKYTYEKGRIKTAELLKDTSRLRKEEYVYNAQGRLQTWTCEGSERPLDYWLDEQLIKQSFTYDLLGNIRTCVSETMGSRKINTATYTYDETDRVQLKKITHSHTQCAAVALEYDAEGRLKNNPLNKLALHYDHDDRQVGSGKSHLAYYDNEGRRVRNEGDHYGEWFYYDGDLPYAREGYVLIGDKKQCDKRRTLLLNQSGSCLAQQQTLSSGDDKEVNTFELKDLQGSVIASWRIGKEGFSLLSYEPFGYRPSKADDLHWLGFTGQPIDRQSGGVYHLGNGYRTYNPMLKVFHAPDDTSFSPFGQGGINGYSYCNGDPRNLVDPTGHAVMVSQTTRMTHAPLLDDPIVNTIFTGAVIAVAAVLTGGSSLSLSAGVGFAAASTGFSVGAIVVREHDPDLASLFDWLSFAAALVPTGGGKAMSRVSRGARGARPANGAASTGRAASNPIVARGGNMRNVQKLRDGGGYMFEDRYKNAFRLNIDAHGKMFGKTGFPVIGNKMMSPEELLALLKRRNVNLEKYANIRLIVCDSATGGAASYAQQLATLSGVPVKGFRGGVYAEVNAAGALAQHTTRRGIDVTTSLILPFAEECVIHKKNPFKFIDNPVDFVAFRYKPAHFKP